MERGCQQNDSLVNGQAEEMETSLEFADELFGSPQPDGKALPLPRVSTVFVAMANDRKALPILPHVSTVFVATATCFHRRCGHGQ